MKHSKLKGDWQKVWSLVKGLVSRIGAWTSMPGDAPKPSRPEAAANRFLEAFSGCLQHGGG